MLANFNNYTIPTDNSYGRYGDVRNTAPSQQGRVIQNAYIDKYELSKRTTARKANPPDRQNGNYYMPYKKYPVNNDNFSILTNELCFKRVVTDAVTKPSSKPRKIKIEDELAPDDGYPFCFSSFNDVGFAHEDAWHVGEMSDEDKKYHIRKQFQLVGAAQTTVDISAGGLNDTNKRIDFSVQIGGIAELHNTGTEDIYAGDWIIWDVRSTNEDEIDNYPPQRTRRAEGTTFTKVLPVIRPLRSSDIVSVDLLRSYFAPSAVNKFIAGYDPAAINRHANRMTSLNHVVEEAGRAVYTPSTENFARSLVRFVGHIWSLNAAWTKYFSDKTMRTQVGNLLPIASFTEADNIEIMKNYDEVNVEQAQNAALFLLMMGTSMPYNFHSTAPNNGRVKEYIAKNALLDLVINMYRPFEDVLSRVVGRAVRSIAPGNAGDVLLGAPYFV